MNRMNRIARSDKNASAILDPSTSRDRDYPPYPVDPVHPVKNASLSGQRTLSTALTTRPAVPAHPQAVPAHPQVVGNPRRPANCGAWTVRPAASRLWRGLEPRTWPSVPRCQQPGNAPQPFLVGRGGGRAIPMDTLLWLASKLAPPVSGLPGASVLLVFPLSRGRRPRYSISTP